MEIAFSVLNVSMSCTCLCLVHIYVLYVRCSNIELRCDVTCEFALIPVEWHRLIKRKKLRGKPWLDFVKETQRS